MAKGYQVKRIIAGKQFSVGVIKEHKIDAIADAQNNLRARHHFTDQQADVTAVGLLTDGATYDRHIGKMVLVEI